MPYDWIIRITLDGPKVRNEYGETVAESLIYDRLHWCQRNDGGMVPVLDRGQRTEQEITYRLRYDPALVNTDVTLMRVYDETPLLGDTGNVRPHRSGSVHSAMETAKARRREIEIRAVFVL